MKIYIKSFCPFCIRLLDLLDTEGITYEKIDVAEHPDKNFEMMQKSNQHGVPEVEIANVIIPDYDTEETLVADIKIIQETNRVTPDIAEKLSSTIVYLN